MADPRKWTPYVRAEGEGRQFLLSCCKRCGAAVMSEPLMDLAVMPFDLHEKWHASLGTMLSTPAPEKAPAPDPVGELVEDLAEELQQAQQALHYANGHDGTFDACRKGRCVQTRALLAKHRKGEK